MVAMEATSLRFVTVAKALAAAARAQGLVPPAFRSPPRLVGVSRSISRRRGASPVVAVVLRNRPWAAVVADMIEGVIVTNRLRGVAADRCRTQLWNSAGEVDAAEGDDGERPDEKGHLPRKVGGVAA
jgi:hypothetical protein